MSHIVNWATQENVDLSTMAATLNTIASTAAALEVLITNFQNSAGTLNAADQSRLTGIQTLAIELVERCASIRVSPQQVSASARNSAMRNITSTDPEIHTHDFSQTGISDDRAAARFRSNDPRNVRNTDSPTAAEDLARENLQYPVGDPRNPVSPQYPAGDPRNPASPQYPTNDPRNLKNTDSRPGVQNPVPADPVHPQYPAGDPRNVTNPQFQANDPRNG